MVDAEAPEGNGIHGPEYNRPQMFMQLVELTELSAQCDLNLAEADFDGLDYPAQLQLLHSRLVAAPVPALAVPVRTAKNNTANHLDGQPPSAP